MIRFPALLLLLACSLSAATATSKKDLLVVAPIEKLKKNLDVSLHSTRPDYVVFVPRITTAEVSDTGNEHFLVFDGPDSSLMAVWTQSTFEGQPDQHIVFVRSTDEGGTWTTPKIIAGPAKPGQGFMASWGFPLVSKSGRIYVLYSQRGEKFDTFAHTTGRLDGIFSDDRGQTWSKPQTITIPRSPFDNPDHEYPANFIVWQKPLRLTKDRRYLVGLTRWTSTGVRKNPGKTWHTHDAHVEFIRFDNIDADPAVADLKLSWFASGTNALAMPYDPGGLNVSTCQEPSIVKLPDGRLFCVMRTFSGSPYWTQSRDDGQTWTAPRPLLRQDGGEPLKHPLSPCPIFDVGGNIAGSGRYVLFIHNHDGHYRDFDPTDSSFHRRPIYIVAGRFQSGAEQPVWFDEPEFFMDHDGRPLGPPGKPGRLDLALYSSFTVRKGKAVLWYPDRKFFLLGKIIEPKKWFGEAVRSREP